MNSSKPYPLDLSLITADEWQKIREWNSNQTEHSLCQGIHQLIEDQVKRTPDHVALCFKNQRVTYRELNQRANQLAHYLCELGVASDGLVGICLERSPEMIIALLGILKAGGAYVPLDPSYPVDRLQLMLQDAQVQFLITQPHLVEHLPTQGMTVIELETATMVHYPATNLPPRSTLAHLGYVIYTSGSTGTPKGVAMPQYALVNLLRWQLDQFPLKPDAKTLQFTPISFDVSFQEIFSTLAAGGTLVLVAEEIRRNPIALLHYLHDQGIERLFLPFVALRQLAEAVVKEKIELTHLTDVITAGEQLRITTAIADWFNRMPHCRLHNHYGPSESHVVTAFTLAGSPHNWDVLPPIGRPIANTQIYLLDDKLRPVPIGAIGELYIGGICLARGYINRPDLTAARFIPDPFDGQSGSRLYRTGDLARYRATGEIEYLGRADQQVKIRGFRVEPGEVEALLEQHPYVKQAVAITREIIPEDRRLVAYVVAQEITAPAEPSVVPLARELRRFLSTKLPEPMLPSSFVVLDSLPLTPSGKVDRRALPIPQWTRMEEGEYIPPKTSIEQQIAAIWSDLLGVKQISIHDSFCALGGHSLLVVRLMTIISNLFQLNLPLELFLETPTIASLAAIIDRRTRAEQPLQSANPATYEVDLDATIYPQHLLDGPIPTLFLTGATGVVGTALLHELLCNTRSDIYCLIRATSLEEGRSRIQNALQRYQLWQEQWETRLFPVLGDLAQPFLGLEPALFGHLAEKVDIIYHSGAWVNLLYPFVALKATNVLGTQEVLRLATQAKPKPVHFISTVDVFAATSDKRIRMLYEDDVVGAASDLDDGYAQSKCAAEKLIQAAQERGVSVSIYRLTNVIGHSQQGIYVTSNFISRMIKGCIELEAAPDLTAAINLISMDYASQAIVFLSHQNAVNGKVFHIVNPASISWAELVQWMVQTGYCIDWLPYHTWHTKLLQLAPPDSSYSLSPIAPLFNNPRFVRKSLGAFHFNSGNTLDILKSHAIICPAINARFLERYFSNLIESGFLEHPKSIVISKP